MQRDHFRGCQKHLTAYGKLRFPGPNRFWDSVDSLGPRKFQPPRLILTLGSMDPIWRNAYTLCHRKAEIHPVLPHCLLYKWCHHPQLHPLAMGPQGLPESLIPCLSNSHCPFHPSVPLGLCSDLGTMFCSSCFAPRALQRQGRHSAENPIQRTGRAQTQGKCCGGQVGWLILREAGSKQFEIGIELHIITKVGIYTMGLDRGNTEEEYLFEDKK